MAARAARLAAAQAAAAAAGAPAAPVDASHGDAGGDEACPERLSKNVFTKYECVAPPRGERPVAGGGDATQKQGWRFLHALTRPRARCRTITRGIEHPGDIFEAASLWCGF